MGEPNNREENSDKTETKRWRTEIEDYPDEEVIVITFPSGREITRALHLISSEPELTDLPWDSPDGLAMFVPRDSVDMLRAKGLEFTISELWKRDELSLQELADLRKTQGM